MSSNMIVKKARQREQPPHQMIYEICTLKINELRLYISLSLCHSLSPYLSLSLSISPSLSLSPSLYLFPHSHSPLSLFRFLSVHVR